MTAVEELAFFLLTQKIWQCLTLCCWGTQSLPLDSHWQLQVLFEESGNWFRTQCLHLCGAWQISMCSFIVQVSTVLLPDSDLCFTSALSNPCWMSWFISSTFLPQVQFSLQSQPMEILKYYNIIIFPTKMQEKYYQTNFQYVHAKYFLETSKWKANTLCQQSNDNKELTWMTLQQYALCHQ